MLYALLGTFLSALGVACLFLSWKAAAPSRGLISAGWLLLLLATVCWILASGAEFGVSYVCLAIPVIAWLLAFVSADVRTQRAQVFSAGSLSMPRAKTLAKHGLLLILSLPVAAVAATLVCVAFAKLLPLSNVNATVLAVFLMPLIWGIGAYWVCADPKRIRPTAWMFALGGASAAFIYL